jgi:uncharacterized membrane protein YhaH (DUF805 family)
MTVRSPILVLPLLLGPSGAIGRAAFLAGCVALASLAFLADAGLAQVRSGAGGLDFLFLLAIAWSAGCLSRKRLHDFGCSGVAIAYFLGFYVVVALGAPLLPGLWSAPALPDILLASPGLAWLFWLGTTPSAATATHASRRRLAPS